MADSSTSEERLIKRVIARFRCEHCHRQHSLDNVSVMGKYEQVWVVGVECDGCQQPGMFVVSMRKDGSLEAVTDLSDEEQERFLAAKSVDVGDVDSIRDFLKDFEGDISDLLGKP